MVKLPKSSRVLIMSQDIEVSWSSKTAFVFEVGKLVEKVKNLDVGDTQEFTIIFKDKQTSAETTRTYRVKRNKSKSLDFNRIDGWRGSVDCLNLIRWRSKASSTLSIFVNQRDERAPSQCTFPGFKRYQQTCFMNAALKQIIGECPPDLTSSLEEALQNRRKEYRNLALAFAKLSDECHKVKNGGGVEEIQPLYDRFINCLLLYADQKQKVMVQQEKKRQKEKLQTEVLEKTTKSDTQVIEAELPSAVTSPLSKDATEQVFPSLGVHAKVEDPKSDDPNKNCEKSENDIQEMVCNTVNNDKSALKQSHEATDIPPFTIYEQDEIKLLHRLFIAHRGSQQDPQEFIQFLVDLAQIMEPKTALRNTSLLTRKSNNQKERINDVPSPYFVLPLESPRRIGKQLSIERKSKLERKEEEWGRTEKVDYISSDNPDAINTLRIQANLFSSIGYGCCSHQSRLGFKAKWLIPKEDNFEVRIFDTVGNTFKTYQFRIKSIVVHEGVSPHSGHYYTLERGNTGYWIKYDDNTVTTSNKPLRSYFSLFGSAAPYLFVLEKA